jgi:hypothetical protein
MIIEPIILVPVALRGFSCDKAHFRLVGCNNIKVNSSVPMADVDAKSILIYAHFFLFFPLLPLLIAIATA